MVSLIEDMVLERIQQLLDFNHWTVYKLAKSSDLAYSSLNNLFNRRTCPSIATLQKICNGFQISLLEFFDFGENPLRSENLSEEEQDLIISFNALSRKDKDILLAYLKGLKDAHRP